MTRSPVVEMRGVVFRYRSTDAERERFMLRVPELVISAGERLACIGPSGSGKTTLVNLMTGVMTPDEGIVRLDGRELAGMSEAARRHARLRSVGMVFQEFELLEYLTVRENLLLVPRLLGRRQRGGGEDDHATNEQRAREVAEMMGIGHLLNRKPRRLSQGERQRVAIGRALVAQAPLIVCDEPTGNLDPRATDRALDLIFASASRASSAVVLVTHNHGVLERFDRIINMETLGTSGATTGARVESGVRA